MVLTWILDIDEDMIWANNEKDIELLGQNLNDITLEADRCIGKLKRYYLVLKVAILSLKNRFLFIALFYHH